MKITVGKIASWAFGIFFLLGGLGYLSTSVPAGIIMALTGIFLIPKTREALAERTGIEFSRWIVVLIALVGLGLGAAFMPSTGESLDTGEDLGSSSDSGSDDVTGLQESESQDVQTVYQVGESAELGQIRFTVLDYNFDAANKYGPNQYSSPDQGNIYVYVKVSAENTGDDSIYTPGEITILNSGQQYDKTFLDGRPNSNTQKYESNKKIQPGITEEGWVRFEVPSGTQPTESTVSVNLGNFFSEQYIKWNLG